MSLSFGTYGLGLCKHSGWQQLCYHQHNPLTSYKCLVPSNTVQVVLRYLWNGRMLFICNTSANSKNASKTSVKIYWLMCRTIYRTCGEIPNANSVLDRRKIRKCHVFVQQTLHHTDAQMKTCPQKSLCLFPLQSGKSTSAHMATKCLIL